MLAPPNPLHYTRVPGRALVRHFGNRFPRFFMRCPYCQVDNDRVQDTRNADGGFLIRRRRVCNSCQRRFITAETIEKLSVRLVKSDQTREPFEPEKIRRGIERACSKRHISSSTIESVVQAIESDVYANFESEVTSAEVGEIVMRHLARLDQVAYIRFASVYREFDDAEDFIRAISLFVETASKANDKEADGTIASEGTSRQIDEN